MRPLSAVVLPATLILAACSSSPGPTSSTRPLTVADIQGHPVIGRLGLPLGTSAEISAEILDGSTFGSKGADGAYFLRVTEVDGKALAEPAVMRFYVPGYASAKIANNDFGLYKLKTGQETGSLSSAQINDLKRGYVGSQVRLGVYESGGYSGIPDRLPDGANDWADRSFGFSTFLEVLVQRE